MSDKNRREKGRYKLHCGHCGAFNSVTKTRTSCKRCGMPIDIEWQAPYEGLKKEEKLGMLSGDIENVKRD